MCNTHVCAHSSKWSANPQLTSSATQVCVFAHISNRSAKVLKVSKLHLTCSAPDMCVFRNKHMCMHTAAIGRPALDPWVLSSTDFFRSTHVCVSHSSTRSAKVVDCSEPSHDVLIRFFCNTHVCARSSKWSANPQLSSSATHVCVCSSVCQSFESVKASVDLFCTRHDVCMQKHTHVYARSSDWSASP